MVYRCECCKYTTDKKFNYEKHLLTVRHRLIEKNQQQLQTTQKQHVDLEKVATEFRCKYCDNKFRFKQSMYRHIKYTCSKNKDEDLKELVELLKKRIEQQEINIETQKQMLHKIIDGQSLLIDKLMRNVEIHGSFNTTNNIQHIQLATGDNPEDIYKRLVEIQNSYANSSESPETIL